MNRNDTLQAIRTKHRFDLIVIGGGATGLWCALDAASRGHTTLLLEKGDFASETSSKSTKLLHGGLRYLKQGHIKLVREALLERERLHKNAPDFFTRRHFLVPYYAKWDRIICGLGMHVYDTLAGGLGKNKHSYLSMDACLEACPTLKKTGLKGGCVFIDGQFDDAKFSIELAKNLVEHGGFPINYCPVKAFIKQNNKMIGVTAEDSLTGEYFEIHAKAILNATGPFVDEIRKMDDPLAPHMLSFSRGSHIVVGKEFLEKETAILVPKTDDDRIIFIIPWLGKTLIGTTDIPIASVVENPKPTPDEIDFLINQAQKYLSKPLSRKDILSTFSGIRPLVQKGEGKNTAKLLRSHKIIQSKSGLFTIMGGKWTTARKMAEDAIDAISDAGLLEPIRCHTPYIAFDPPPKWTQKAPLSPHLPLIKEQIQVACQEEMTVTLTDMLARRSRCLFLDAKESQKIALQTAQIMAKELQYPDAWVHSEVKRFEAFAKSYCL